MKSLSIFHHRKFAYSSLFIIAFVFLLVNIRQFLIIDYGYWIKQTFDYTQIIKSGNYFPDFMLSHPAVTVINLGSFSFLIKNIFQPLVFDHESLMFAYKLPFILVYSFFTPYLYFLLKKTGFATALSYLAALLFSMNFIIWEINAADLLYSIFFVSAFFNFFIYLKLADKGHIYFFLSAIFAALSILSRFSGALLIVIIPALMLYYRKNLCFSPKKYINKIFLWFLLLLISLFILRPQFLFKNQIAPAAKANIDTLTLMNSNLSNGNSLYEQRIIDTLIDLPLLQILFISCFVLFLATNFLKQEKNRKLIIIILLVSLLVFFSSLVVDKSIWSYRYALPSFLLLDIIVAYEITRQFSFILSVKKYRNLSPFYALFIVTLFIYEYYFYSHLY
ncbi:MAG: hypothetical protein ABIC19_03285 [Patescibacteria group bacterium]